MQPMTNWNLGNPDLFQIGQDFCPALWEHIGAGITLHHSTSTLACNKPYPSGIMLHQVGIISWLYVMAALY